MALSKENAIKLRYLFEDGHEIDFIQSFIKIANKNTKIVPFILTPEQRYFVENLEKFNIVLKSRQLGLSVCTVALSIRQCIVYPNSCCLLVSHDQKSCNSIFDKLKQQFNSLPDWLRPKQIANNRQEIKLVNGSKITCVCAGNKDVARGDTLHIVHLSEFAYWKMSERQLNSITQALAPEGRLIIESTANGLNYFNQIYFQAKRGENAYKSFFFSWINGAELFKDDYKKSVEIYKARNNNRILKVDELDEEEQELMKLGMSIEQAMWRRLKVASTGLDAFHQEFPSTDIEAFITSGANVFNNKRINTVQQTLRKDNYIPKANITDLPSILQLHYGKSFFMWKLPAQGQRYYIGVDSSEGVGQDYQVVEVFSKDGEQVAEFYNNMIKPYEMAEIIDCIGRYYNKGILNVERASGGHSIIERLRYDYKYMNMVKQKMYDEFNKVRWTIGFDTNSKSKGIIINDMVENFDKGQIKINSIRVLEEMKTFNISDSGSMGASKGYHDDTVMAVALALFALKDGKYYLW